MKFKISLIITLLVGCILIAYGVLSHKLNLMNHISTAADATTTSEPTTAPSQKKITKPSDIIPYADKELLKDANLIKPIIEDKLINILLVGQDKRPGEGRQRSDTMILCSVNIETKQVSLISFLRDLYVEIPGDSGDRLNAAYVYGGFPLLKETLQTNFGVNIDGCFEVDFSGFTEIIDQIGGIDINLTAAEAKIVADGAVEGDNHLSGKQALRYARIRKIDDDFCRTNRQRQVLLAAYKRVQDCTLMELISAVRAALPFMTTDMNTQQIIALGTKLFTIMNSIEVSTYQVPPEGMYEDKTIRGMAVLYPDLEAIRNVLESEYLPISKEDITTDMEEAH